MRDSRGRSIRAEGPGALRKRDAILLRTTTKKLRYVFSTTYLLRGNRGIRVCVLLGYRMNMLWIDRSRANVIDRTVVVVTESVSIIFYYYYYYEY